ncbi:uncharacterized [Tachysurus ichikawai]
MSSNDSQSPQKRSVDYEGGEQEGICLPGQRRFVEKSVGRRKGRNGGHSSRIENVPHPVGAGLYCPETISK